MTVDHDYIVEGLRGLAVPVDTLNEDPDNANTHPEKNLDAIEASLSEFGQDQPLVVQKEGMIVRKGNGRLQAAKNLGWTHVAAIVVDESRIRAISRAIADNRTSELSEWSESTLAGLLDEVYHESEDLFHSTGFEYQEYVNLRDDHVGDFVGSDVDETVDSVSVPEDDVDPTVEVLETIPFTCLLTKAEHVKVEEALNQCRHSKGELPTAELLTSICKTYLGE